MSEEKLNADLGWDDVIVEKQAIARIGFVMPLPDGRPLVYHWSFCSPEGVDWEAMSYTPRELQRISNAFWVDKPLPKMGFIGEQSGGGPVL